MSKKKNNSSKNKTNNKKPQSTSTSNLSSKTASNQSSNKGKDIVGVVSDKLEDAKKAGKTAVKELEAKDFKILGFSALKVILPIVACIIVLAVVISIMASRKNSDATEVSNGTGEANEQETVELPTEPLATNSYPEINELMSRFFRALADGEMDTVAALCDGVSDTQRIIYEKKSEFIESYDDLVCYSKKSVNEDSYFVYVTFLIKFNGVETKAPGLNAFYVYTKDDGSLVIDGDMDENVKAVFDLVTVQDDVVDLYKRIDVDYKELLASDEELKAYMDELPAQVTSSVGVALAQLEEHGSEQSTEAQTEESSENTSEQESQSSEPQSEEITENKTVNEIVKTTDTVNVRSSDSEEADKIGARSSV